MEARNRLLKDWFTMVRNGQIALPRFQRFEAWNHRLIESLLTSVIRELPIGSFLILGVAGEPPFYSRPLIGAPQIQRITELLLDGQQRLTGIWRSLNDDYPDRTYLVYIPKEGEEETEPYVIAQARWKRGNIKYPLWVDDPKECWTRRYIPLRILNPENETEYVKWAELASNGDKDLQIKLIQIISNLRSKIARYPIPFLYLEPNTSKETAIEVFIRMNTSYVKLSPFDIAVAQMEEAIGESLHDLVGILKRQARGIERYIDPSELVLPVAALLQGRAPTLSNFIKLDFRRLREDWDSKVIPGARRLVEFLEEESVFDSDRLPTQAVLAPLVALWAEAPTTPREQGNVRILLRKYIWRAFFTNRYDRAVPTAVYQDYRALKRVINNDASESEVPCLNEDEYVIPNKDILLYARWPKYKDRLARAVLLLSLRGGAEDIADGARITPENIKLREYHHLFPVAYLRNIGKEPDQAYRALNCILVTWRTNRIVAAKSPLQYLRELCGASLLGEEEIRRRLKTHFIDFDLLLSENYEDFLEKRAAACEEAIKKLCNGIPWRP